MMTFHVCLPRGTLGKVDGNNKNANSPHYTIFY
jgi:hypothetical protein